MLNQINQEQPKLEQSLAGIELKSIAQLRSYAKPPPDILKVVSVLHMILNQLPKPSLWPDCKQMLSDPTLIQKLSQFEINMKQHNSALAELKKLCSTLDPLKIQMISCAAFYLFQWLITVNQYYSSGELKSKQQQVAQQQNE